MLHMRNERFKGNTTHSVNHRSGRDASRRMLDRLLGPYALVAMMTLPMAAPADATQGIARVAWLQGCWELVTPQRIVEEHWMAPRAKSMLGVSRTVRDDKLIEYELVVLREQGSELAYEARPAGQPPAVFVAREVSDAQVIFENPQHDFPQRIGYRRIDADTLLAWIEGQSKGRERRVEFPYRRARCSGT